MTDAAQAGQQILDELRAVKDLVAGKSTPEETSAFNQWLLASAQAAADAAKEGGFLGFGATQISDGEQDMLDKVRPPSARNDSPHEPAVCAPVVENARLRQTWSSSPNAATAPINRSLDGSAIVHGDRYFAQQELTRPELVSGVQVPGRTKPRRSPWRRWNTQASWPS